MSKEDPTQSGEDRLIARYFEPIARHPGAFALADDAAAIAPPPGCDLVLKTDGIVGGVHFFPDDPPDTVARKALRVNLSDLAAKGARPLGFLLTLALPAEIGDAWLAPFAQGLGADVAAFGCPLFGGDTVRTSGPVTISIAVVGTVPHGKMVRRSGAKPGDRVLVTGTIGDAALGLLLRRDGSAAGRWKLGRGEGDHLASRYLVPQPRTGIADALRTHASAAMDLSDGLAGDLAKLCRVSGVDAEIELARLPLSDAAQAALVSEPGLIETIVTGGDDYEILACVPPQEIDGLRGAASSAGIALTEIGEVRGGNGAARLLDARGKLLSVERASFSHF
jgi:thiamine-monophosphate kinase